VLGGRLLDRFGKGLRGAPRDALIADAVIVEQRGQAFGLHRAFDTAGALAGVLLSAALLWWLMGTPQSSGAARSRTSEPVTPAWIYRAIFGVSAALGLMSLVLTFLVRESQPSSLSGTRTDSEENQAQVAAASTPVGVKSWLNLPRSYWWVLGILTFFSLANSSDTFILLRANDLGYSPWAVVLVYALYNTTYATLSYPAGVLSDSHGRWRIVGVGWTIYAAVYVGMALLPSSQAWGIWPLMAAYGIYMALTDGIGKALIADHSQRQTRGAAMGLFYALTGLTTLGASVLTGVTWDRWGHSAAFLIGAGFAILSTAALFILRPWRMEPR
jgi:MFS family permease